MVYGMLYGGGGVEVTTPHGRETRGRCDAALELLRVRKVDKIVFACPEGEAVSQYLRRGGAAPGEVLFLDGSAPYVHDTFSETCALHDFLDREDGIIVISSFYHLPRIFMSWIVAGRMVSHFAPSWHCVTPKSLLREVPRLIAAPVFYLYRGLFIGR